ncbi:MAG: exosortase A [Rhizobacter sp.]|nr:exosortase A [Rhizobacter sp.]
MNEVPARFTNDAARWRSILPALVLVLGAVLVAYRDTAAAMVSTWHRSETFAHAFLVIPIVVWLIWRRRHELAALTPRSCPWMLVPMALVAFAWLLGDLASVRSVTELAFTTLLVLSVPAVLGLEVSRVILFPLAFTFFSVPIGDFLLPQLMAWTADFTVLALRATGVPVFREGNQLVIPSGHWAVVEACSGVRYLIASFMVGTLFAYLHYRSATRRWTFAAMAIAVPIVANWVRAYLIVLLGHLSNNTIAVGVDHLIYGWLFFGLVMGLLYGIGTLWSEAEPVQAAPADRPPSSSQPPDQRSAAVWAAALATVAIAAVPHLALGSIAKVDVAATPKLGPIEAPSGGWHGDEAATDWKPAFRNPLAEATHFYRLGAERVGVYMAYYRQQSYERKLVGSSNALVRSEDPDWLQVVAPFRRGIEIDGHTYTFTDTLLRRSPTRDFPEQRLRVWQVYWVAGTLTSSEHEATLLAARNRLLGRGDDAAAVLFYTPADHPRDGESVLESFARANLGAIVSQLDATRAGHGVYDGVAANTPAPVLERSWK